MSKVVEVTVPDIGDFKDVDVIEVLVRPGDRVAADDSLVTLESDKATMEVPSPGGGVVREVSVKVGGKVSRGSPLCTLEVGTEARPTETQSGAGEREQVLQLTATPRAGQGADSEGSPAGVKLHAEVLVLGSGPGGYTAAFRAADLGKQVVLVERYASLGGVCLNVGCIPSKALLHLAKVIEDADAAARWGVHFERPRLDVAAMRTWKEGVVTRLTRGIAGLAKQRNVKVVHGSGSFVSPHELSVDSRGGPLTVSFDYAIIAAGSRASTIPTFPNDDSRLMDSTAALMLEEIPGELLVIGGGIIGLEMASVYSALGARITVVELTEALMPGCDVDLVRPLHRRISKGYENIYLKTKVTRIEPGPEGLTAYFEGDGVPGSKRFDRVLVAVGRRPNGRVIGAENAGVRVSDYGFIDVDRQQRTNVPHIFAIGDIVGPPLLAHKATHEGKVAAEVIAGLRSSFDARVIPSVAYTDPEVAWAGVTEDQAKEQGLDYGKGVFPWAASGRSLALGRDEGMTKLLFDRDSRRIIGAGIVGPSAGDLIAEAALAIEMGSDATDIGLTIHPHPTLSETLCFAAEAFEGTITDLYLPRR
jgi:dihydrolipoamide dehydrogenase